MVYKQGCTDSAMVKKIQKAVGCTADGIWGAKTTEAVKQWQRNNGLVADGIVGPKSLELMQLNTQQTDHEQVGITKLPIMVHVTRQAGRPLMYIAIHYTAGGNSLPGAAAQTRNVFVSRAASADYVVDDAHIIQVNPDVRNYYCRAVGDKLNKYTGGGRLNGKATNRNTVSIEICSTLRKSTSAQVPNHEGWSFSEQALDNARRLVRHLMQTLNIPKDRVIRHYDVTGKMCPGVPGWNDGPLYRTDGTQTKDRSNSKEWQAFWESI